eukprot:TRINITY_DN34648_c0_g1_i1.p1 TRINITY_DN34648_c0_g1~~TRINITY_DN34648_c0_g1_i1.p1  ORF type:complete len:1423 (+),score=315.94 TRINITY_DN34648_c0_g1_i1:69-4337(+)
MSEYDGEVSEAPSAAPSVTWESRAFLVDQKKDELNKDQWKLIRDHVQRNMREVSKVFKEVDQMKADIHKLESGSVKLQKTTTKRLDQEFEVTKRALEEEKAHRVASTTSLERQIAAVMDRLNANGAADEIARQKFELGMASAKKDNHEKHEVLIDRISALEASLETRVASGLAEIKNANHTLQSSLHEQVDALKELQETHRLAANDAAMLEKRRREQAIHELNDKFQRCLQEEKKARDTRDQQLEESLEARIDTERNDRDASVRGMTNLFQQERSKREQGFNTIEQFIEEALANERAITASAHGELNAALNREKIARESHRASTQSLIDEEREAREAHIRDLLAQHAAAKVDHQQHVEKELQQERSLRTAALADMKKTTDGYHDNFKGLIDQERADRAAHLDEKVSHERAQREKMLQEMFEQFRAEGDAVLQEKINNEVSRLDASVATLQDLIEAEKLNRGADVEELMDVVGAERISREEEHAAFEAELQRYREEFEDYRDSIHQRIDEERGNRQAHHDTHVEHLKGLLESEGQARSEHHLSLSKQVEQLRSMLAGETEIRTTSIAEMQGSIAALEEAVGDGYPAGMECSENTVTKSRRVVGGLAPSTAMQSPKPRVLVPLQKRLNSLEEKILEELGLESQARGAHCKETKDMLASEAKLRDDHHGTVMVQLESLHGKYSTLQRVLEKERGERAAHLDAHRSKHDKMHALLRDRSEEMHRKQNEFWKSHKSFQDTMNQMLSNEVQKLRQLISTENDARDTVVKALRNRIDGLRKDLSEGLSKEAALRKSFDDRSATLWPRLEYLEAVLEDADDMRSDVGSVITSPGVLSTSNMGKRVVTVQHRLEDLERRFRNALCCEIDAREVEAMTFREHLQQESELREGLQNSVKRQFEKERGERSDCLKEASEQLAKEIEALRTTNSTSLHDFEHREQALVLTLETSVTALKRDLDEEKFQRIAADKACERLHTKLAERVGSDQASNETHQQRLDLAAAGQKKDVQEKHDFVLERLSALEKHLGQALPAAVTELREADSKLQQNIREQIDAVKALQKTHRSEITNLVESGRSTLEEAIHNLQGHMTKRFAEEKTHRDAREASIADHFNGRLGEEKSERDAGLRSLSLGLTAEKNKRDGQLAEIKSETTVSLADHRKDVDAKQAELRALVNREKDAREAHRAEVQALHNGAKESHDADIRAIKVQLDTACKDLKDNWEEERATVMAHAKENQSMLDDQYKILKIAMDEEVRKRDSHFSKLGQMLNVEKQARDKLLSQYRGEHEASLKETANLLRQEHAHGLKRVESATSAGHTCTRDMIAEASRRLEYVENVLGERYLSDTQMTNVVTIRQQLDMLKNMCSDGLAREAKARESECSELRQALAEKMHAHNEHQGHVKECFAKERAERQKMVSEAMVGFKSALIRHFDDL